jgi:predicted nucleotidyltransferase
MREATQADIESLDLNAFEDALDDAPVTLAVLYGSHARGEATVDSDIDVAVRFDAGLSPVERTRARLSLIERLSTATGTDAVDILPLTEVPDSLVHAIRHEGVVLYGREDDLAGLVADRPSLAQHRAALDEVLTELDRVV